MMKGFIIQHHHHQQQQVMEDNMSNLTSASGDASVSSGNRPETASMFPQPLLKKKRNLPGNPDPEAEVIALSPKALMATNRFICEICSKGFQRDQNLQLHRRGHNLPWKLKQRSSKEVRKKVYVCPEEGCVHHEPSRALGDLTGIKKHFSRKHGEKKWKCDKCSKRYAVQSDWKAHSKTCGSREYRCDCGTLFSRRDSFITHRAFCDALAEESARAITAGGVGVGGNNSLLLLPQLPGVTTSSSTSSHMMNLQFQLPFSMKKEEQNFSLIRPEIPPWLSFSPPPVVSAASGGPPPSPQPQPQPFDLTSTIFSRGSAPLDEHDHDHDHHDQNPNSGVGPTTLLQQPYHHPQTPPPPPPFPHMSATALLQKAAQMGATMSTSCTSMGAHQGHVSDFVPNLSSRAGTATGFGLNLSSPSPPPPTMAAGTGTGVDTDNTDIDTGGGGGASSSLFQDMMMMNSLSSASGFCGSSFEDSFSLNSFNGKTLHNHHHLHLLQADDTSRNGNGGGNGNGNGNGGGMTRDFLGLRAFSHSEIMNMAGLGNCMNQNQTPKPWQG